MSLMIGFIIVVVGFWILMAASGRTVLGQLFRGLWVLALLAGWIFFAYLALGTAGGLDGAWAWARAQPTMLQVGMWLFLLPYMVALWIGQTDWALWVRVVLVCFIAMSLLATSSAPKRWMNKPHPRSREAW